LDELLVVTAAQKKWGDAFSIFSLVIGRLKQAMKRTREWNAAYRPKQKRAKVPPPTLTSLPNNVLRAMANRLNNRDRFSMARASENMRRAVSPAKNDVDKALHSMVSRVRQTLDEAIAMMRGGRRGMVNRVFSRARQAGWNEDSELAMLTKKFKAGAVDFAVHMQAQDYGNNSNNNNNSNECVEWEISVYTADGLPLFEVERVEGTQGNMSHGWVIEQRLLRTTRTVAGLNAPLASKAALAYLRRNPGILGLPVPP
jgi:hypothetical protein